MGSIPKRLIYCWTVALLIFGAPLLWARWSPSETSKSVFAITCVFAGVPLAIVTFLDLAQALRSRRNAPKIVRVAALLASTPQLCLGLLSLTFGLAIIAWVLFNLLIERQPQFTGWTLWSPFGIAPIMIAMGWQWISPAWSAEVPECIDLDSDAILDSRDYWDDE